MCLSSLVVPVFVGIKRGLDTCFKITILKGALYFLVHTDLSTQMGKKVFFCTGLIKVTKLTVEHMVSGMTRIIIDLGVYP